MKYVIITLGILLASLSGKSQSLTVKNGTSVGWYFFISANSSGAVGEYSSQIYFVPAGQTITYPDFSFLSWNTAPVGGGAAPVVGVDNWDRAYFANDCIIPALYYVDHPDYSALNTLFFIGGNGNTPALPIPATSPVCGAKLSCGGSSYASGFVNTIPNATGTSDVEILIQ